MTKIADIMDRAARDCRLGKILSIVSATSETAMELKDQLLSTVEELLDRLDLPSPITVDFAAIGAGAGTSVFALPPDFKRLTRDPLAVYGTSSVRQAYSPISTNGEWTALMQAGSGSAHCYRIFGDDDLGFSIEFSRPIGSGERVVISYVSKNWARDALISKSVWSDASDKLLLPETLTRLGVVWRFKQRKGMAFADVQADYEIRLSRAINDGRGIRSIDFGGRTERGRPTKLAIPDVITFN